MSEENDTWQIHEIDLEYALKLVDTLRWRTWPEEKPKARDIVVKRWHLGEYIIMTGLFRKSWITVRDSETAIYLEPNDQWMYLSDLEVVR